MADSVIVDPFSGSFCARIYEFSPEDAVKVAQWLAEKRCTEVDQLLATEAEEFDTYVNSLSIPNLTAEIIAHEIAVRRIAPMSPHLPADQASKLSRQLETHCVLSETTIKVEEEDMERRELISSIVAQISDTRAMQQMLSGTVERMADKLDDRYRMALEAHLLGDMERAVILMVLDAEGDVELDNTDLITQVVAQQVSFFEDLQTKEALMGLWKLKHPGQTPTPQELAILHMELLAASGHE